MQSYGIMAIIPSCLKVSGIMGLAKGERARSAMTGKCMTSD